MTEQLLEEGLKAISSAKTQKELKEVDVKHMGRNGKITELMKTLKDMSVDEKRDKGQSIQNLKKSFIEAYTKRVKTLQQEEVDSKLRTEFFDITLSEINPTRSLEKGSRHPLSLLQKEIETIFSEMGFQIADGPEVESEYYNFEALNIPSHHPARDMQDTFFIDTPKDQEQGHLLLRTHTSSAQIRAIEKHGAPLRIIVPGRVFRYEATDATHDSTFNQVEGMLIDKKISLASFKGIVAEFLSRLYKKEVTLRFRPGYFPFVEPGIEIDILWKKGENGKPDKWLEIIPAGMIHPNVLKAGKLDPDKHQGWAFGMGLTRLAMIKYGIDDIRNLHANDLRFLRQF
jgi:phenylalanyl-tRNA synthetase alpha chain